MNNYKVLTLWQPWASLLVCGVKKIETRPKPTTWTKEKGTYLIHAASKWTKEQERICLLEPFKSALIEIGALEICLIGNIEYFKFKLPLSKIIGSIEIEVCCLVHRWKGIPVYRNLLTKDLTEIDSLEYEFGNYAIGRYAWITENPRQLINPIPYKGGQGYYVPFKGDINLLEYHV